MKSNILFLIFIVFFSGCETGKIPDKNESSKEKVLTDRTSRLVERHIDALVDEDAVIDEDLDPLIGDLVPEKSYIEEDEDIDEVKEESESKSVEVANNLEVHTIRVGQHNDYTRVVLDVYKDSQKATSVGSYRAKYYPNRDEIVVALHGYSKFSASLPSFPSNSVIEEIRFSKDTSEKGYKMSIKLREEAKVRIFDLKNPARLAFDIKPI